MNWKGMSLSVAFAAVALFPKGGLAQQAAADSNVWYKLCVVVPVPTEFSSNSHVCETQIDVRDAATAVLTGRVGIRQVAEEKKSYLVAMLPLGSALPPGALVKIDGGEAIKLTYTSCDQAGCYAEANIELAIINQMKSGSQIAYLSIDVSSGRAIPVMLPLEGFARAFDGAPMSEEKYNEDQRKMAEVIKARCAELRRQKKAPTNCPAQ